MTENKQSRILQDIVHLKNAPTSGHEAASSKPTPTTSPVKPSVRLDGRQMGNLPSGKTSSQESSGPLTGTPFPNPSAVPTQEGRGGIRYDFNVGMRIVLPEGRWKVRLKDLDTRTLLYETEGDALQVMSRKRHFIRGRLEVLKDGELFWSHDYDASGKRVAVVIPGGTLGDSLGWFPYAVRFAKKHNCQLTVILTQHVKDLLQPMYPEVRCVLREEYEAIKEEFYATYYIGLFFHDENHDWQPSDFRLVGLHRTAGHILGVDPTEEPPKVVVDQEETRPIEEPYVVVAVQASCGCKMWNNPSGWMDTVQHLKNKGYRVICIDREPVVGYNLSWNALPFGVEDETGDRSLSERARWLKHADFFIGLSSGLSWLAWAVNTPVVMISGFTHPSNEFYTPYRVFSTHGCNSCWHDVRTPFQHNDYMFCPRHKDTPRFFECTRIISSDFVMQTIDRLCEDYHFPQSSKGRVSANIKE